LELLADLIQCANNLTTQYNIDKLAGNLPNCEGFGLDGRTSLVSGLRKIGRHHLVCVFLLRAAQKLSIFKRIEVEVVVLPTPSEPPCLFEYSPNSIATLRRVNAKADPYQLYKILSSKGSYIKPLQSTSLTKPRRQL
jgi:hypothetical protein